MSKVIKNPKTSRYIPTWDAKEDEAIERFVAAWERYDGRDSKEVNTALDALTVAHIAATFEWASGPLKV